MRKYRKSGWGAVALVTLLGATGCSSVSGLYGKAVDSVWGGRATPAATPAPSSPVPAAAAVVPAVVWQPRAYAGDISAARAYLAAQRPVTQRMQLVDVRDASEYRLGHPEGAHHMPYPRVFQACQPHPSGALEAELRSEDGSQCRYGVRPGSEVRMTAQALFDAMEAAFPYKDAPLALIGRTGAHGAQVAHLLARPQQLLGTAYAGKGYTQVYNVVEGFVGSPQWLLDPATQRLVTRDKKTVPLPSPINTEGAFYGVQPLAQDLNRDGQITLADYSGWRYHQGLPFVTSLLPSLLHDAAQPYYAEP